MSSRSAAGRTAFENLRPTILRQPARSAITAEAEARLLDSVAQVTPGREERTIATLEASLASIPALNPPVAAEPVPLVATPGRALLQKKKRDLLVPVTFRMPHSLKERLEQTAKRHEVNQTDLINEAIDLNLQRYS